MHEKTLSYSEPLLAVTAEVQIVGNSVSKMQQHFSLVFIVPLYEPLLSG